MYNWLVFFHIFFAFLFMFAHGVYAAAMLKFRGEPDPERARTFFNIVPELTLSRWLIVLFGVPAFIAAYLAGWLTKGWMWASTAIFLIITFIMVKYGAGYYILISRAMEHVVEAKKTNTNLTEAMKEYDNARNAPHPMIVSIVGIIGLAIILWLMRFKPF